MSRRLYPVFLALAACVSDQPTESARPTFAVTSSALTLVAAGDIARCGSSTPDGATGVEVQGIINNFPNTTVAPLGDLAYENGSDAEFQCYDAVWGSFKSRTRPAVGNHEYQTSGAAGYFNYFGAAAGERGKGYYSYDIGTWHLVAINTNIDTKPGSAQDNWLAADLEATNQPCILAYMHHPRFASQVNLTTIPPPSSVTAGPWERLYAAGADLVLAGHSHRYERFLPLTPDGTRDDAHGIREIIAGTGGDGQGIGYKAIHPMSVVRSDGGVYGVVQITLGSNSYTSTFQPIAGVTFTDDVSGNCHGGVASSLPPPPIDLTVSGRQDSTKQYMTLEWTGAHGTTVDVYRNGAFQINTANDGHYTNSRSFTGSITYTYKVCETGGTTVCSNPASVTFGGGSTPPNSGPSSSFAFSCTGLDCSFSDRSFDSDGTVTGWGWNFGDGSTAATQNPSHSYTAGGTYTVTLVARDDRGANGNTSSQSVTVTAPPVSNTAPSPSFTFSCTGLDCSFTDKSTDSDGSVTGWSWSFGDNATSTAQNPTHSYASVGDYTVTLVATDDDGAAGASVSQTVGVTPPPPNTPPSPGFTVSCTGFVCSFTDTSTDSDGSVTGWSWTFGDAGTETTQNPNHTYAGQGTYTVTLVATDDDGSSSDPVTHAVEVTPPPPNSPPSSSFTATCTVLDCSFQDASNDPDGSVTGWSWAFGDGGTSTAQNPSHTYAAGGSYDVTLVATDNAGATGNMVTHTVTVTAPPANTPPNSSFTSSCTNLACAFTDASTDGDGSVTAWNWTFGDGGTSTLRNPSHSYTAAATYTVTLIARDNQNATGNTFSRAVTVSAPANAPPAAKFTSSCTRLACTFTDGSTDADGTVTAWRWTFGDGATSAVRNPSRTYAAAGTYTVTLTATDNRAATGTSSKSMAVFSISLTLSGRQDATTQYMTLDWVGARGTTVDVYRNGAFHTNTANDGHYVNSRNFTGAITYTYKVCETGTTICSNSPSVTFK